MLVAGGGYKAEEKGGYDEEGHRVPWFVDDGFEGAVAVAPVPRPRRDVCCGLEEAREEGDVGDRGIEAACAGEGGAEGAGERPGW